MLTRKVSHYWKESQFKPGQIRLKKPSKKVDLIKYIERPTSMRETALENDMGRLHSLTMKKLP